MDAILSEFCCPSHFLVVLREFHDGLTAKVVVGGHESDPFSVIAGVKQGCVLAPVINLFLVAVTLVFRHGIFMDDGLNINYGLDGNLFNIRRLRAQSKAATDYIFELQYADDAALLSLTAPAVAARTPATLSSKKQCRTDASISAGGSRPRPSS